MTIKERIKAEYVENLRTLYAGKVDYSDGSRALEMAEKAADAALAGQIKLEGVAWFQALANVAGLRKTATKAQIAALEG